MSLSRNWMPGVVSLGMCLLAATAFAQGQPGQPGQGGGRGGFGGGFGGFGGGFGGFGGGGPFGLLQREDVKKELEVQDDQETQLRALGEKARERMGEMFRGGRGGPGGPGGRPGGGGAGGQPGGGQQGGPDRDAIRDTLRKFNEEMQAEVDKVLLPHQSKRLKQLEVQFRMRGGALAAIGGDVAEQIGVTEADQERLREKSRALEQELRKKMAVLRKEAQDQLLGELSPDQRSKFKELVGEPFEFQDEAPPGFGGPGGPGGRGGPGGGDRPDRPRRPGGDN